MSVLLISQNTEQGSYAKEKKSAYYSTKDRGNPNVSIGVECLVDDADTLWNCVSH